MITYHFTDLKGFVSARDEDKCQHVGHYKVIYDQRPLLVKAGTVHGSDISSPNGVHLTSQNFEFNPCIMRYDAVKDSIVEFGNWC